MIDEQWVRVGDAALPLSGARAHASALLAEFQARASAIHDADRAWLLGRASPDELADELNVDREALLVAAEDGDLDAQVDERGHAVDRRPGSRRRMAAHS
jgi:hypothetical protein